MSSNPKVPPGQAPPETQKVRPYPFDIQIIKAEGIPPVKAVVLKITDVGFLMQTVGNHHFKVGDNHVATFELPAQHKPFKESVKVIKTYDAADVKSDGSLGAHFLIEMHFRSLPENKREEILNFLKVIGQK